MNRSPALLLASAAVWLLTATPAQAQSAAAAPDAGRFQSNTESTPDQEKPGDIVVTARRRSEHLQDVPESVTAFTSGDIANAGIKDFRNVADLTPNFSQTDNYRPGLARFQVRGLITPQVGDPPLAFVFDGVTAPDQEFVNQDLFDVESIQVLRGAQGALYGRGAIGGAVIVETKQPTNDFAGYAQGSYANGDTYRVSSAISGPIVEDRLYFRVGGYYHHTDGLIDNFALDRKADYDRSYGGAALLKAAIGPDTTIDLRGQYGHNKSGIGYYQSVDATTVEDFSIPVSENVLGVDRREIYQISGKVEHGFDWATLTMVGGYSHSQDDSFSDGDYTALPSDDAFFFPSTQRSIIAIRAWTIEARLTSLADGPFRWALGSFFQDRRTTSDVSFYDDVPGTEPVLRGSIDSSSFLDAVVDDNRSRAWALSAQASYDLTRKLELTIAGRYDRDHRRSFDPRDASGTLARATFDAFQPKASLSYKATSDLLFYTGYSKGFRSGGFNEVSDFNPRVFGKETSDSYEAGFKSSWFGRRLTINAALFRIDQHNAQLTQFNPLDFTLYNVAIDRVRSQGGEIEVRGQATPDLAIALNAGFTDSKIKAFATDPGVVGDAMPYVPRYTASLQVDYTPKIGDTLNLIAHLAYRRIGARSFDLTLPDVRAHQHDFVDGRLGLRNERWEAALFVENLFNERQPEDLFAVDNGAVAIARQPNRPRSFGVEARVNF